MSERRQHYRIVHRVVSHVEATSELDAHRRALRAVAAPRWRYTWPFRCFRPLRSSIICVTSLDEAEALPIGLCGDCK